MQHRAAIAPDLAQGPMRQVRCSLRKGQRFGIAGASLDNLRAAGVACRDMFGLRCGACEAKDSEIARLTVQYNSLMDRFMIACGKPEAVATPEIPESAVQEQPAIDIERETEKALLGIAESRGMNLEDFADA